MHINLIFIIMFLFNSVTPKIYPKRLKRAAMRLPLRDHWANTKLRGAWRQIDQRHGTMQLRAARNKSQSNDKKPEHGPNYDPDVGYEPYWQNGSWALTTVARNRIDSNYSCGFQCTGIYRVYGLLCARNRYYEYKNFNSYCDMKSDDCFGYLGWTVAYRGECNTDRNKKNWTQFIGKKVTPFKYSPFEIQYMNS